MHIDCGTDWPHLRRCWLYLSEMQECKLVSGKNGEMDTQAEKHRDSVSEVCLYIYFLPEPESQGPTFSVQQNVSASVKTLLLTLFSDQNYVIKL